MSVWVVQTREGAEPDAPLAVSPNHEGVPDAELLVIKAESAEQHGWTVTWVAPDRFVAVKRRWAEQIEVTRTFWSEP